MQIKSVKIDAVIVTAGSRGKKPNTVNLVVNTSDAIDILQFYELQQRGEDPVEGIRAVKLMLEYVEEDGAPKSDKLELTVEGADESDGVVEEDLKEGEGEA